MNAELTLKIKGENGDTEITDLLNHHVHHELVKKNKFPNNQVLKKLNEIVSKVENDLLPLDEAMRLYQEGNSLIKDLQKTLDEAEKKIEVIKSK